MDSGLSTWLQLRESADAAARSESLIRELTGTLATHDSVRVLDLASGTGANVRHLAPRLPPRQRWLAVDRDAGLLAQLPALMSSWGAARGFDVRTDADASVHVSTVPGEAGTRLDCLVETRQLDLGSLTDLDIFADCHFVTASALLDLVSEQWLAALAARCRAVGAMALFAITYNGRSSCSPVEPEDEMVRDRFNRHQRTDKGLGGPAAGPDAADCAARSFADVGYLVESRPSDWVLDPTAHELQRALINGWAEAATEVAPGEGARIAAWRARRMGHVDAGRSRLVVGHLDLAAWLPPRP